MTIIVAGGAEETLVFFTHTRIFETVQVLASLATTTNTVPTDQEEEVLQTLGTILKPCLLHVYVRIPKEHE